jgi:hypothetical protein
MQTRNFRDTERHWNICAVISDVKQLSHPLNDQKNKRILTFVAMHTDPPTVKFDKLCLAECLFIACRVYSVINVHAQTQTQTHTHTHTHVIISFTDGNYLSGQDVSLSVSGRPTSFHVPVSLCEFNCLTDDRRHSSAHTSAQNLQHRLEQTSQFIHYSAERARVHARTHTTLL